MITALGKQFNRGLDNLVQTPTATLYLLARAATSVGCGRFRSFSTRRIGTA
jgi:hypothetical protein